MAGTRNKTRKQEKYRLRMALTRAHAESANPRITDSISGEQVAGTMVWYTWD
jgi:hypothetical protein